VPWAAGDIALWLAAIVVFGIIFAKHYAIAIVVGAAGIPVVAASSHLIWRSRTERFGCGCDAATAVRHWARTNAVGAAFFGILCVYFIAVAFIKGANRSHHASFVTKLVLAGAAALAAAYSWLARRRGLEEIDVLLAIAQAREVRFSPDDGRLVSKDYTKSKSDEGI